MCSMMVMDKVLNIAHRGASSLAPENTLSAARKGLAVGADMWELDVQLTADGELIVIHDSTLKRTSNVEDLFPHRRPWQVGGRPSLAAGPREGQQDRDQDERGIPFHDLSPSWMIGPPPST